MSEHPPPVNDVSGRLNEQENGRRCDLRGADRGGGGVKMRRLHGMPDGAAGDADVGESSDYMSQL